MSIKDYKQAQLDDMAMIDIATIILEDANKAMDFREIFNLVADVKGLSEAEKDVQISQFYTDLNIDGRFLTKGSNLWGLKRWYPIEDIDEDITAVPKRKKKKRATTTKKKKAKVEEPEDVDETVDENLVSFDDEGLEEDFDEDEEDDKEEFDTDQIAKEK